MHDQWAGIGGARHAKELKQIEVLFNDVTGFIFPDPVAFDEVEIRDIEVMIAVANRARTQERLDKIVFPAVGGEGDDGGVVVACADAQDVAQGAEGRLAEEIDEEGVADSLVGLEQRFGAAEHDEHVNGEIGARGFEGGKKGRESKGITDAGKAHADDRTA